MRFAIEHTIIEPYVSKLRDDHVLETVMAPVLAQLRRIAGLPPGSYFNVSVDAGALAAYRGDHRRLSEQILAWTTKAIRKVPAPAVSRSTAIRGEIGDPPIEVMISRWGLPHNGPARIAVFRSPPYRLEDEREKRVLGACKRKLLKLSACAKRGMRTVLVLENPDVALTNFTLVHGALMASLRAFPSEFEPNEVYLGRHPDLRLVDRLRAPSRRSLMAALRIRQ